MIELDSKTEAIKSKFKILQEVKFTTQLDYLDSTPTEKTYAVLYELLPSKIYYVPLYFAYRCRLYVAPKNLNYKPAQVFDIRGYNIIKDATSEVCCKRVPAQEQRNTSAFFDSKESFFVQANDFHLVRKLNINVKSHRNVMPSMHANFKVSLFSPIKLSNCLPFNIRVDVSNQVSSDLDGQSQLLNSQPQLYSASIDSGEASYIHLSRKSLENFKVHIIDYLGVSWIGGLNLNQLTDFKKETVKVEMRIAPTIETQVSGKHLNIYASIKAPNEFTFYAPYWLVNKSGQPIKLRVNFYYLNTATV